MCHVEEYEEQCHEGGGSQCGNHCVDVHEKCLEHRVVLPGNLPKLCGIMGL